MIVRTWEVTVELSRATVMAWLLPVTLDLFTINTSGVEKLSTKTNEG